MGQHCRNEQRGSVRKQTAKEIPEGALILWGMLNLGIRKSGSTDMMYATVNGDHVEALLGYDVYTAYLNVTL